MEHAYEQDVKEIRKLTRSHLQTSIKRSMDHMVIHRSVRGLSKMTSLKVDHKHDPSLHKLGKIIEDGGAEANRLWELRNGPIRRK